MVSLLFNAGSSNGRIGHFDCSHESSNLSPATNFTPLAHSVERDLDKVEVPGSEPGGSIPI